MSLIKGNYISRHLAVCFIVICYCFLMCIYLLFNFLFDYVVLFLINIMLRSVRQYLVGVLKVGEIVVILLLDVCLLKDMVKIYYF